MGVLTLVDTDILIDAGHGLADAVNYLQGLEKSSHLAISAITQMELMIGCQNKTEMRTLDRFLVRFQILKLDISITDRALVLLRQYRLSHGLLIADARIAAAAMVLDEE